MTATSSYLNKPLRTLAEALADRRKAPSIPEDIAALLSHEQTTVLLEMMTGKECS